MILLIKGLGFILDFYGKKQKALEIETYQKNCIENGGQYKTEKVIDPVGFPPPSDWIRDGGLYGYCEVHTK